LPFKDLFADISMDIAFGELLGTEGTKDFLHCPYLNIKEDHSAQAD
jgi:hypothetical protein